MKTLNQKNEFTMTKSIQSAIILSAGFGKRMLPLTKNKPKPMIKIGDKTLIDLILDDLNKEGIQSATINVHYKGSILIEHLKKRNNPKIIFSNETNKLLDTGGGVKAALNLINDNSFLVTNCDGLWKNGLGPVIRSLNFFWKRNAVDAVICLVKKENTFGYDGKGDFFLEDNAEITRPKKNEPAPYVYSGIQIIHKRIFEGEINESFSFNKIWDKAIKNKKIKAVVHDDIWFHVGKPDMVDFTFRNLSKK